MMIVERGQNSAKCDCGGYAEKVASTPQEIADQMCGRLWACCTRAFVCGLCGKRLVAGVEAPEME